LSDKVTAGREADGKATATAIAHGSKATTSATYRMGAFTWLARFQKQPRPTQGHKAIKAT